MPIDDSSFALVATACRHAGHLSCRPQRAVAIWLWHAPALYQATLGSEVIHTLQHGSFLGTGLLFWWALLRGREGRWGRPAAGLYLFTTSVHTTVLGALLTFSARVWYPTYASSTSAWRLTPLEDQQLAGLIMWVPAGLAYLLAALVVAASWLREPADNPNRWIQHPKQPDRRATMPDVAASRAVAHDITSRWYTR